MIAKRSRKHRAPEMLGALLLMVLAAVGALWVMSYEEQARHRWERTLVESRLEHSTWSDPVDDTSPQGMDIRFEYSELDWRLSGSPSANAADLSRSGGGGDYSLLRISPEVQRPTISRGSGSFYIEIPPSLVRHILEGGAGIPLPPAHGAVEPRTAGFAFPHVSHSTQMLGLFFLTAFANVFYMARVYPEWKRDL